jgi:hypothetical protein
MAITEITSIQDIITLLQQGVTDFSPYGMVSTKTKGDLVLFNYTNECQYAMRWNYFEQVSRGLIINRVTGEIVARPWTEGFRAYRHHHREV